MEWMCARHLNHENRIISCIWEQYNGWEIKCWVLRNTFSTLWWDWCFSMRRKYGVVTFLKIVTTPKGFSYKVPLSQERNVIYPLVSWDKMSSHWHYGHGKGCLVHSLRLKKVPLHALLELYGTLANGYKWYIKANFCVPIACKIYN